MVKEEMMLRPGIIRRWGCCAPDASSTQRADRTRQDESCRPSRVSACGEFQPLARGDLRGGVVLLPPAGLEHQRTVIVSGAGALCSAKMCLMPGEQGERAEARRRCLSARRE